MTVTRADVARRAGVSPTLVSYVLNPGSRPVSAGARQRIEAAIEELGYRPNAIAQALRRSSSHSIGLLIPTFNSPVIAALAEGIEAHAREHGYVLLTGSTGGSPEREAAYLRLFLARHVDALILISTSSTDALAASAVHVPILALDTVPSQLGVSSVLVDGVGGAESAVRHLIEAHGHTRIACISADWPAHSHAEDRITGWRRALRQAGLPAGDELIIQAPTFDRLGGRAAVDRMLSTTDATAAFITSDIKAVGALDGLRSHGVRVPEDFAVVAYDGTVLSESTWPSLTTVNQFMPEVAAKVIERLIAKIGPHGEGATHDVLPTQLIIRESCGCR